MRNMASVREIEELKPIEGADKIETARVRGWWVVVQKGQFEVGQKVVYCEIDSMFLEKFPEIEFLWDKSNPKTMFIDYKKVEGIVLKTIKLRGQISQGLVLPMSVLDGKKYAKDTRKKAQYEWKIGKDVSELLNIIKYEKPVPANLSGEVKGSFPSFLPKTDETRLQSCLHLLTDKKDVLVYISEKVDGTSFTCYKKDGEFGVCSRNLELKETEGNSYWDIAKEKDLANILPDNYSIQGELAGPSIQSNPLKLNKSELFIFNVWNMKEGRYLDIEEMEKFCADINLETVPIIVKNLKLNHNFDELMEIADEKSLINQDSPKEGIVIRGMKEQTASIDGALTRFSFKVISNNYLLKEE